MGVSRRTSQTFNIFSFLGGLITFSPDNKSKRLIMETKVPMPMTVVDPDKMFGQEPAQVQCSNCHQVTTTRVESSVRSEGWMFACCCFFCGSWLTSLLVCCLP